MVEINVPIGKRFAQRERLLEQQQQPQLTPSGSDLKFLHDIAEDTRFTVTHTAVTNEENLVTIQPDIGTTFFFLGAQVDNLDAGAQDFDIRTQQTTGPAVNRNILEAINLGAGDHFVFNIPIFKIVGDGNIRFILRNITKNNATGSIWGWNENTRRIQ